MTAQAVLARQAQTRVPFDLAATQSDPNWRDTLRWPLHPTESKEAALRVADELAGFTASLDQSEKDTVLLAMPVIQNHFTTYILAALAFDCGAQEGIRMEGGPPALATLAGSAPSTAAYTPSSALPHVQPRWRVLRRAARTASWTPLHRLPRALRKPDAIAVSHNSLLRAYARSAPTVVGFQHAEHMLEAAGVSINNSASDAKTIELAKRLVDTVMPCFALTEPIRVRLAELLREQIGPPLAQASAALSTLAETRSLPTEMWLSTAGRMPARTLAIAARRRGARITTFDHGGGIFLQRIRASAILRELAVSDRLVVATEAARALRQSMLPTGGLSVLDEVAAAGGDPTFMAVPVASSRAHEPRRVMYMPTPLLGFRQVTPPILPDPVALDWQLRLASMLGALPIELLVKPHPEGVAGGARHPVSALTRVTVEPYPEVIGWPNLFVFEYPHSTAFWEALCTRTPVVWIDLGTSDLPDAVRAIVARRCLIIEASFDERNRPQIDPALLDDAVRSARTDADPAEIRILLAGERL